MRCPEAGRVHHSPCPLPFSRPARKYPGNAGGGPAKTRYAAEARIPTSNLQPTRHDCGFSVPGGGVDGRASALHHPGPIFAIDSLNSDVLACQLTG
jgi:hypothetical protein